MTRLRQHEISNVLECVGQVYTLHDVDTFAADVLALLSKPIATDFSSSTETNLRRKRMATLMHPQNVVVRLSPEQDAIFFREHPFNEFHARTGNVSGMILSDFCSRRQYRETALYRDVFRSFSIEFQMGCGLRPFLPGFIFGVSFVRSRSDFNEHDRLIANLIRPHLYQAYRNAEMLTQFREQSANVARGLEAASQGIIILDGSGRIKFCSERARHWLENWFEPASRPNGTLRGELQQWLHRQQLPAIKNGTVPAPRQPFILERNGRRLTIRLLDNAGSGQRTLLFEERSTTMSAVMLQKLGLSARQSEVLLWLAQGKTNPEIGTILGLSAGTVHKHTEHIYAKLGVETRTAAAARAWETANAAS